MKKHLYIFVIFLILLLTGCNQDISSYRIDVDLDGGYLEKPITNYALSGAKITLNEPNKEGYTFIGWFMDNEIIKDKELIINKAISLKAIYEANNYKVSFNDLCPDINVTYGSNYELPIVEKAGYDFLGWYYEDTIIDSERWNISHNVNLVPKWEKQNYLISFTGEGIQLNDLMVNYNEPFLLPNPEKVGYIFMGWLYNNQLFDEPVYLLKENITLEASWHKLKVIHYVGYYVNIDDLYYQDSPNELSIPYLENYQFEGWYIDKYYQTIVDITTLKADETTLYAKWSSNNPDSKGITPITLYNTQNSQYIDISLYEKDIYISASKYWHKIGVTCIDDSYYVSNIKLSGEGIADLEPYDYVIMAYSNCPLYSELQTYEIGEYLYFSTEIISIENGECSILVEHVKPKTNDEDYSLVTNYLTNKYLDLSIVTSDIDFVTNYLGYNITWKSSNKEVISSSGKYQKPSITREVTIEAIINQNVVYKTTIKVPGYKETSTALATGYIYTNFDKLTDNALEGLDILYCSFAYINTLGEFTNTANTSTFMKNVNTYIMTKKANHSTKILVSVNQKDKAFGVICKSAELREKVATNIVNLINTYGFDGVDIDWEYPASDEVKNFTLLMKEIYTKVKANNPNHLVTAAIGGGKWQPPRYDLTNSHQYLDYINLMTYSMTSSNGQYQNALYRSTKGYTLVSCSIEESIAIYDSYNVPRSKILVGLAFYGIRQYDSSGPGTSNSSSGSISYKLIVNDYLAKGYQPVFDEESGVPYIYDEINKVFISYENETSIKYKCDYVNAIGLGGVMYWQYGHDYDDTLVNAIKLYINK